MLKLSLAAVMVFLNNPVFSAELYSLKSRPESGKVEFEAVGRPSMIKINGSGAGPVADLAVNGDKISGTVVFQLDTLSTGIDERDAHMRDNYLHVKDMPSAKLTFTKFQMPAGWSVKNPQVPISSFRGKLWLHGVEKELTGMYSITSDRFKMNARFEIKLADYKIDIPTYLNVKVADLVKVSITIDQMQLVK